jgi:hypothetical protein
VCNSLDQYKEVWAVDFEFIARPGEKPVPVCLSAQELRSGRKVLLWQDQFGPEPPFDVSSDSLFIAYYASAELNCHRSLGWKQPERILDLYVEFKNLTNGFPVLNGKGLLGALAYYGLGAIDATEKTEMRDLVLRGGPWTEEERTAILEYCKSDTDSLARLLVKMLCHIDLPGALYRGRYMSAVSAMESNGVPHRHRNSRPIVAEMGSRPGQADSRSGRRVWSIRRTIIPAGPVRRLVVPK